MHDIVFSREMIAAIEEKRKDLPKGAKVVGVNVLLSPLSHVTSKTLSEAFRQMAAGTDLEHITVTARPLVVKMKCSDCGRYFPVEKPTFACVGCGSSSIVVADSREFLVESLDVEGE